MLPDRGRTVHLAESLHEILGDGATQEASRRMIDALDGSQPIKALLWFDVWAVMHLPATPGQRISASTTH